MPVSFFPLYLKFNSSHNHGMIFIYLYFTHYFVHYLRINLADIMSLLLYRVKNDTQSGDQYRWWLTIRFWDYISNLLPVFLTSFTNAQTHFWSFVVSDLYWPTTTLACWCSKCYKRAGWQVQVASDQRPEVCFGHKSRKSRACMVDL